ncbi:hypothetical protein BC938DRAFT_477377 [Jimgerdemannia flammicorona]|uniref:AAA-ATPase-like domain-containing protein n=1 Tax=Jimgerdemannia flammicorona TaxID=994334 RepID=A0A433QPC7_9FUNG|nr:hypothetical protein BC938DRAFT_477377 [Jimgerdemannia flammicorona]
MFFLDNASDITECIVLCELLDTNNHLCQMPPSKQKIAKPTHRTTRTSARSAAKEAPARGAKRKAGELPPIKAAKIQRTGHGSKAKVSVVENPELPRVPVIGANDAALLPGDYTDRIIYILRFNYLTLSFLLLKDVTGKTWNDMSRLMRTTISQIYNEHAYLRYHQQKCIVLTDEYDVPISSAYHNGYYEDVMHFLRPMFSSLTISIFMVGILRIGKSDFLSSLNNVDVFPMTRAKYATSFGFMEDEVRLLLKHHNVEIPMSEVTNWYNGYLIGMGDHNNPKNAPGCQPGIQRCGFDFGITWVCEPLAE